MNNTETLAATEEQVQQLVERLSDSRPERRAAAEHAISQLGPQAAQTLLKLLDDARRRRKRNSRLMMLGLAIWLLFMLLMAFTGHGNQVSAFFGFSSFLGSAAAATQMQKNATKALAVLDDPAVVGPLAESLEFGDKALAKIATERLTALLPKLKASDASLLLPEQRAILYKQLKRQSRQNVEFSVAILKSLEQIGDEKAVAVVRELAQKEPANPSQARIVAAAKECLPFVEERAEQMRVASTLLRPVDGPGSARETLLRAADGAPQGDPELLLRPSDGPTVVEDEYSGNRDVDAGGAAHVQA